MILLVSLYLCYLYGVSGYPIQITNTAISPQSDLLPQVGSEDRRELWEILRSCFLTIVACTWMAVHPNVPAQDEGWFAIFKRRLTLMVYCIIAPEVVMIWAMRQWHSSRQIANRYSHRGWTQSHGFLVEMGGYMLCDSSGKELHILTIDHMQHLHHANRIKWPSITEKQIHDKSKADPIAKALVLFQTTWFMIQTIARGAQKLAITELELVTLGYAVLNGVVYFLWWYKPANVECTIAVHLGCPHQPDGGNDGTPSRDQGVYPRLSVVIPSSSMTTLGIMGTEEHREEESPAVPIAVEAELATVILSRTNTQPGGITPSTHDASATSITAYSEQHLPTSPEKPPAKPSHPSNIFARIHSIVERLTSGFIYIHNAALCPLVEAATRATVNIQDKEPTEKHVRVVPMFYVTESMTGQGEAVLISLMNATLATIFGGLHCIAWNFAYPTPVHATLWKIGSLAITFIPTVLFLVVAVAWRRRGRDHDYGNHFFLVLRLVGNGFVVLYIGARLLLLVQAFVLLHSLPDDAYRSVGWTKFIPHF